MIAKQVVFGDSKLIVAHCIGFAHQQFRVVVENPRGLLIHRAAIDGSGRVVVTEHAATIIVSLYVHTDIVGDADQHIGL